MKRAMRILLRALKNEARLLRDRYVIERLADSIGEGRIDPRAIIRMGKDCEVALGKGVVIGAFTFISVERDQHMGDEQKPFLRIGTGTYIGEMNNLRAAGGIQIGSKCLISQCVSLISSNHSTAREMPVTDQPSRTDRVGIKIDDDVWVGANATILPGVRIGRGAVIAANSVVTKSVPEYTIVGGIPAQHLKERT